MRLNVSLKRNCLMTIEPGSQTPFNPLSELPPATVEVIQNATVIPMAADHSQACGVFRPDRQFCEMSRAKFAHNRFSATPKFLTPTNILKGRHIFAGIGRHHFGHFLLESLPRLWALEQHNVDGVVFIAKHGTDFGAVIRRRFGPFLNILTNDTPIYVVENATAVEELILPTPGIGHLKWTTATPEFRAFIRNRLTTGISPDGPERLYVSRSKLKREDQMIDQEKRIERMMKDAGYTVFHPQKHTLVEQCQRYMAARKIVGPDGSPFHLAPFVMQPGTQVGLIQRRWRQEVFDALANQIESCADVELTTTNPLVPLPIGQKPDDSACQPIDFHKLQADLRSAGLN